MRTIAAFDMNQDLKMEKIQGFFFPSDPSLGHTPSRTDCEGIDAGVSGDGVLNTLPSLSLSLVCDNGELVFVLLLLVNGDLR